MDILVRGLYIVIATLALGLVDFQEHGADGVLWETHGCDIYAWRPLCGLSGICNKGCDRIIRKRGHATINQPRSIRFMLEYASQWYSKNMRSSNLNTYVH